MFFILIHWLALYPHDNIKQILLWWFSNFENIYLPIQQIFIADYQRAKGFPCGTPDKEFCNAGDLGSIPGLGRSPGEGKGYPLQYSGLENSMDCIVYGLAKSQTKLSRLSLHCQRAKGFPGGASGKESSRQCRRHGFNRWVGKMLWRRAWQPTPVFLPGEAQGQRSLVDHSPWGHIEWATTEAT